MTPWNCGNSPTVNCALRHCGLSLGAIVPRPALLIALTCASLSLFAAAQDKNSSHPPEPLAVIGGQTIDESQFPAGEQLQLQRMMQQVYGVELRALHEVLDQKLVDAEARRKGVSVEDLVKTEVISKAQDPSGDQVGAYYQAHQGQINQPFDEAKDRIRLGMKEAEIQRARMLYIQGLWQQAVSDGELVVFLNPPKLELPIDPARLRGDPKAPVTILEFSDFTCLSCRKAESTLTELLTKYPGQVKLGYRDFPLREIHPQAQLAAEASRCAGEQGKYWEYHDLLFAEPDKQTREGLLENARTLKLDEKQFDTCLSSGRFKPQIDQDIQLGTHVGVVTTPEVFVNGILINSAQPAADFQKIIDQELSTSKQKPSVK
jgi:protein-disulfide isomerase